MVELKEFDFEADIYAPKQNEIPRLTQYDTSIALNFFLTSKFAPLDLTNSTVKARFLVPKINQLVEQGIEIIDATEGVCRVLIDDSVTVEPGTIQGLLDVFDTNGHKLSVLKFSMIVDEYLGDKDGDITSDTSYPILNQLIESISILRGDLLEAEASRERSEMERNAQELERINNESQRVLDFNANILNWESRFVEIESEPSIHSGATPPSRNTTIFWFDPSDNEDELAYAARIVELENRIMALESAMLQEGKNGY